MNTMGEFGLVNKTWDCLDFAIGTSTIWFDRVTNKVYEMTGLLLSDYIEGVWVEDVRVSVEFSYTYLREPGPNF